MHAQGPTECFNRREESDLQSGQEQPRCGLHSSSLGTEPRLALLPILVKKCDEFQFGGVGRQSVYVFLYDLSFWESIDNLPKIIL